jgi:hypothetical protein
MAYGMKFEGRLTFALAENVVRTLSSLSNGHGEALAQLGQLDSHRQGWKLIPGATS